MTIQNWQAFKNNHWDWACLDGCFGRPNVKLSDIDGIIGCSSKDFRTVNFLSVETKAPNVPIPTAQLLLAKELQATNHFTVFIVHGKPQQPEYMTIFYPPSVGGKVITIKADLHTLRDKAARWYRWAKAQTR